EPVERQLRRLLYGNEEVKHRRENPGKAAMTAVIIVAALFILAQLGLQGVVSPAKLQANSASALVYVSTIVGGPVLGKCAAIALALSVVAGALGLGERPLMCVAGMSRSWVYYRLADCVANTTDFR